MGFHKSRFWHQYWIVIIFCIHSGLYFFAFVLTSNQRQPRIVLVVVGASRGKLREHSICKRLPQTFPGHAKQKPWKTKTHPRFWGFRQLLLGHLHGKFMENISEKLCIIILLHFELITCRFGYGRTIKPLISMISAFFQRVLPSQNQYYLSLETPGYLKQSKKFQIIVDEIAFLYMSKTWKSKILKRLEDFWKGWKS